MQISEIPFGTTDWATIPPTEHRGETGTSVWRTREFSRIRVRMVEYSPGYRADHWCEKGHILLCLAGELEPSFATAGDSGSVPASVIKSPMAPKHTDPPA